MPPYSRFRCRFACLGSLLVIVYLAIGVSQAFAAAATTSTTLAITAAGKLLPPFRREAVTLTATVEATGVPVAAGGVSFCDAAATSCSDIHLLGWAPLGSTGTAQITLTLPPGEQLQGRVFRHGK